MPNVKLFVDETVFNDRKDALAAFLPVLRGAICDQLAVPVGAVQLVVVPVLGVADQTQVNMEIHYLAAPGRTKQVVTDACAALRELVADVVGAPPAMRAMPLDPETYVALK